MEILWLILGILYLISGCIYLYKELGFIKNQNDLLIISYARLMYSMTFGFIPCLLCFLYSVLDVKIKLQTLVSVDYSSEGFMALFLFWIFSVLGYISLNFGYKNKFTITYGRTNLFMASKRCISDFQSIIVSIGCLTIGIICLYLWTKNEGDIFNFIVKANWYRGDYTNSQNNIYAMFKIPSKILEIATFLFFFNLLQTKNQYKLLNIFGYLISLFFSILYLLCIDGRLATALFFGMQLIGFLLYKREIINISKKDIYKITLVSILALVFISQLDSITYFIRYGSINDIPGSDNKNIFISLMNEFGYIYESAQMSIKTNIFNSGELMILDDIVRGIYSCLPSKFTPEGFERVWRWNTYLCTGSYLAGTIPCDIISEAIYDLGIIGPIIIPFLLGVTIKLVETFFEPIKKKSFYRAFYICFALAFFRIINYCELYDFMRGIFSLFIAFIVYKITMITKNILIT